MDKLQQIVSNELEKSTGLQLLALQNHLYGCFILMEDLASQQVQIVEENDFALIGLQYGFVMDTSLLLDKCSTEYKTVWMDILKDISLIQEMEMVDEIEDALLDTISKHVMEEDAFFKNALETGSLNQEWTKKALHLLKPDYEPHLTKKTIRNAKVESNKVPVRFTKSQRLARTYRKREKSMARTYRNKSNKSNKSDKSNK